MRVDEHGQLLRFAYVVLAAISGAFTALGFTKWRELTVMENVVTLVVSFSFAVFVTPWIAHDVMRIPESNTRALAAMIYVFGSGSQVLLPMAIRWAKRLFGQGDAA